jgi:hypothetical protein
MSEQPVNPVVAPSPDPGHLKQPRAELREELFPISRSWMIGTGVAVGMTLLALLGVGLTTTSRSVAPAYWISLVPIYGAACAALAWARGRHHGRFAWSAVTRQVLHWVGIAIALGLDFFIRGTGEETGSAAGMNALLLLALGCYLAGVHLDWLFALVGVLLTVALIILTKAEEYLWLIFVVGAVTIAVIVGLRWLLGRAHARRSLAAQASAPVATGS